jgi:hypothetical protein
VPEWFRRLGDIPASSMPPRRKPAGVPSRGATTSRKSTPYGSMGKTLAEVTAGRFGTLGGLVERKAFFAAMSSLTAVGDRQQPRRGGRSSVLAMRSW